MSYLDSTFGEFKVMTRRWENKKEGRVRKPEHLWWPSYECFILYLVYDRIEFNWETPVLYCIAYTV